MVFLPLLAHFLWTQARWTYWVKRNIHSPASLAQTVGKNRPQTTAARHAEPQAADADGLIPIDALTAQPRPVVLHEEYWQVAETQTPLPPSSSDHDARVEPRFSNAPASLTPASVQEMANTHMAAAHVPVLTVAPPAQQTPSLATLLPPHAVMQYVVRLGWDRPPSPEKIQEVLNKLPWPGAMPVQKWTNPSGTALELGLYLVSRTHAAQLRDFAAFDRWVRVLAESLNTHEPPVFHAETALLQTRAAQNLLSDLDSVFNVRLYVPASQLNLFEQSLVAARFITFDEHWLFQDTKSSEGLWLERLWGAAVVQDDAAAIFQMAIDIPNLGILEARKAYMRLRAVARASAAIVQTDQSAHLSEGMLEKFAREITHRQDNLSKAGIEPGSPMARHLFKPRIKTQKDFAAFHAG